MYICIATELALTFLAGLSSVFTLVTNHHGPPGSVVRIACFMIEWVALGLPDPEPYHIPVAYATILV